MKPLLLGSSSPRRYELMRATGLPFTVARPDIDETPHLDEAPDVYVQRLSREKALAIPANGAMLILTADTTVADGNQILGKPENADEATTMLRQLRGHSHYVHTGVSLRDTGSGEVTTSVTSTEVMLRAYTDDEIAAYVASGDPFGKAGSYGIQNVAFHPVGRLDGCFTNVVGLPLCAVCTLLRQRGVEMPLTIECSPNHLPCQLTAQQLNLFSGAGERIE